MRRWWGISLGILSMATIYVCYCLLRPLSIGAIDINLETPTSGDFTLDSLGVYRGAAGYIDPSSGSIQCRALGEGEAYDTPRATASLAKLITVQVILDAYSLETSESGETLTMTADDVNRYIWQAQNSGSYVRVTESEQITVRQMLEGILLASANNMADGLAIWVFGSIDNYRTAATQWLVDNGLTSTTIGSDASGLSPDTTSTPVDICKIMLLATKNSTLSEIMDESEATQPTGDVLKNTNKLLGQNGIFAGKTGYNTEANRGVAVAGRLTIDDTEITYATVSLSNDSYQAAFDGANLIASHVAENLRVYKINRNQKISSIATKWGSISSIVASQGISTVYWSDQPPTLAIKTNSQNTEGLSTNSIVGQLVVGESSVNLLTNNTIRVADASWRLSNPF